MDSSFLSKKDIEPRDRLILALDVPTSKDALALVQILGDNVTFYKIGLQLFMAGKYFELIDALVDQGKKVFVDLKFFDVPETVKLAVAQLCGKGVTFATVHGNDAIMKAAAAEKGDVKILAVTALTSLDEGDMRDLGFSCDIEELVLSRARRALESGCDGVISSGLEARKLRERLDDRLLVITPGIRPVQNDDDQKRVVSVEGAFLNGADHIVVGRPIRNAGDPVGAAKSMQEKIASLFK